MTINADQYPVLADTAVEQHKTTAQFTTRPLGDFIMVDKRVDVLEELVKTLPQTMREAEREGLVDEVFGTFSKLIKADFERRYGISQSDDHTSGLLDDDVSRASTCGARGFEEGDVEAFGDTHNSSLSTGSEVAPSDNESSVEGGSDSSTGVGEAVSGPHPSSISQGEGRACADADKSKERDRDLGIIIAALDEWADTHSNQDDPDVSRARKLAEDAVKDLGIFAQASPAKVGPNCCVIDPKKVCGKITFLPDANVAICLKPVEHEGLHAMEDRND